jgi:hypothetical protein
MVKVIHIFEVALLGLAGYIYASKGHWERSFGRAPSGFQ